MKMNNMRILIKEIDLIKSANSDVIKGADIGIEGDRILFIRDTNGSRVNGSDVHGGVVNNSGINNSGINDGAEASDEFKPDKVIDGRRKLAIPGLVNCHTHSAMTLLRGFADDLALETWLFDCIIPAESKLEPEDVYWGSQLGIIEMIRNGTTCFNDMYLNMDEVGRAVYESGVRSSISIGPLLSGKRGDALVDIEGCKAFFEKWDNKDRGRITTNIEIHSIYMYTEETLREGAKLAKELNSPIHIHVLETAAEKKNMWEKHGKTSFELAEEYGLLDTNVIAAHCVHVSDADIAIMVRKGVNAVHNPSSNLKLASGIAPLREMIAAGVNVCLGTDGTASNNTLSMFKEMYLAAIIHKGVSGDPTLISASEAFKMATENGAKALGFTDCGVIRSGAKADIAILDMDKPHLTPLHNYISSLVYSVGGQDTDTVIVDGKVLMENRRMLTLDEEKVMYMAGKISKKFY
jgi:5-methylthioadenosine/S-adenosylhomocysteine deaminase